MDSEGKKSSFKMQSHPDDLKIKMKLLGYFMRFMSEHLLSEVNNSEDDKKANKSSSPPRLQTWMRKQNAMVLSLTNGIVQVNNFTL